MRRQHGAALLTAMIIVTLVATLAASMVWQQWRAVQVEAAERARVQSAWMLAGALDWSRLILRESAKPNQPTWIDDQWAKPLEEARLSTFLAADANNTDDAPDVFLSGDISDAQARFNLGNLVNAGVVSETDRYTLRRLCVNIGLSASVADAITLGMVNATAASAAPATAPLLPMKISQLSWFGISPDTIQALEPYVVLLTDGTKLVSGVNINANTASREVLAAAFDVDPAIAERVVQLRKRGAFRGSADYATVFQPPAVAPTPPLPALVFTSDWFIVRGRLRLADRMLEERSLVRRNTNTNKFEAVQRERVASRESPGN
ncbi:type II secretion system minor pseudopilin GspK [soil metagenome]